MREIPLTNGGVALVDDDDAPALLAWLWYRTARGYARRTRDHRIGKRRFAVLMHREIALPAREQRVDHVDGDGLHNTRGNLRLCTQSQNNANTDGQRRRRSRYKGVTHDARGRPRPFFARITMEGRTRRLGSYATEEEAAHRYDEEALKVFGAFSRLNFPEATPTSKDATLPEQAAARTL